MSILTLMLLVPIAGAFAIAFAAPARAYAIACISSAVGVILGVLFAFQFEWTTGATPQLGTFIPLLPDFGISIRLGVDSVAAWLIVLTQALQPLCVVGSRTAITERTRTYYAWLTILQSAMLGVFMAHDLIFFYVCFEFTLIPMYVLISLYGSTNRKAAATKFFLYTFTGSIIALAGLVYVASVAAAQSGQWTFALDQLQQTARSLPLREQTWVLLALLAGFAVKVPLFPLHTWLPLAHTEAPTAGSVILAGVLLKLGTYAIFRFVIPFVPAAVVEHADTIAIICIVGILYGGLICWVQRDVKKLVAYSSVAHLGFCMLGMFALNIVGGVGSVLYMINHGLSTGALFFCIGMIYERYHTRSLEELGGLAARMPVWAFFMVFFTMASVGLPGLNGFVSEFMCLLGAFQSGAGRIGAGATHGTLGPWYAAVAGVGMIVAAIYLLFMVGRVVFGPLKEPAGHASHDPHHPNDQHAHHGPLPTDLSTREIAVLAPLALACIILGVYPTPVIRSLEPSVGVAIAPAVELLKNPASPGATSMSGPEVPAATIVAHEGGAQ
ncbi:MAG: NADH-quinone oxidoreductase subunit M [Planctomycetota bacterium]|nr:NADH-quinone oxidoreductase subunit M [Planctomycetota bacterium]